jgi:hypothetical protein
MPQKPPLLSVGKTSGVHKFIEANPLHDSLQGSNCMQDNSFVIYDHESQGGYAQRHGIWVARVFCRDQYGTSNSVRKRNALIGS